MATAKEERRKRSAKVRKGKNRAKMLRFLFASGVLGKGKKGKLKYRKGGTKGQVKRIVKLSGRKVLRHGFGSKKQATAIMQKGYGKIANTKRGSNLMRG